MEAVVKFLSHEQKGSLFAILSGLLYGFLGYFGITIMAADFSITTMQFWRFAISSLAVCVMLLPKLKSIKEDRIEIIKAFFLGAFPYAGSAIIYFFAAEYIGTGLSMVIFFTYPAFVMVLNYIFYKTKILKIYFLALFMIAIGMVMLIDIYAVRLDIAGIGLGLLSAVFYAGYMVFSKKNRISPLVSTLMVSLGCTITSLVISLQGSSFAVPSTLSVWMNVFGMGIICTAIPILFLLQAMEYLTSEKASILSVLEPVFVMIFGVLLLGEKVSIMQTLGILTVLSGAVLTLFSEKTTKRSS